MALNGNCDILLMLEPDERDLHSGGESQLFFIQHFCSSGTSLVKQIYRIVMDTERMVFEGMQLGQIDVDDLLQLGRSGGITGNGGLSPFRSGDLFGYCLRLLRGESLLTGSFLTLKRFFSGLLWLFGGAFSVLAGRPRLGFSVACSFTDFSPAPFSPFPESYFWWR